MEIELVSVFESACATFAPPIHASRTVTAEPPRAEIVTGDPTVAPFAGDQMTAAVVVAG